MNLFNFFNFFSHAHSEIAENGADKVLSSEEENPSVHKTYVNFPTSRKRALDAPLYAISFLFSFLRRGLQIRRNFSTTCTTLGTRGEKLQVDAALCGRSMVEMLGVLAIIGVLSVGAIAGYSKAMLRYKLNKQAEQLNTVFNAVARYYTSFNDITQKGIPLTSYFIKMNEIPTEMIKNNNTTYIYDVFNTRMFIRTATDPNMSGVSIILYPELLKQSAQNLEICRNILTTVKENHQSIYFINPRSSASWNVLYGDSACNGKDKLCLRDMSLDYIYKACATHGMAETLPEIAVFWRTDI